MKQAIAALFLLLSSLRGVMAQSPRPLTLEDAVKLGIDNSKELKQAKNKVNEAQSRLDQTRDAQLPSAKVSFQYLHALMLTQTINIPGITRAPLELPFDLPAYLGTLGVSEPIFAGNQFKLARKSADLVVQMSKLDADKDKDAVTYIVISAYLNYNKIQQNQAVEERNRQDVEQKLAEIKKYEGQGLATRNDVLRFELQKSRIQLQQIELEKNRKIANFDLDIILGLPDTTQIMLAEVNYRLEEHPAFDEMISSAMVNRREVMDLSYQDRLADVNIKKIHDQQMPTLAASAGAYYINPTKKLIPDPNTFIAPITLGLGVSWDIGTLWTNKNKVREATIQKQEIETSRDETQDAVRRDVHQAYLGYLQAVDQLAILQVAVDQAEENERITESKYQNNLASTTDRIDAQTLLYQSRVNLELAKSDATIAYYTLLNSTGSIHL